MNTETINCDLCGSDQSEQLLVGQDFLHGTKGQWPVVKCIDCGLIFTNPRPAPESLAQVYPDDYNPYRQRKRKKINRRWKIRRWAMQHHWNYPPGPGGLFAKIFRFLFILWTRFHYRNYDLFPWQGRGKLLDYGCGGGKYLNRLKDLGWQVTGMDMSEQAVEVCKKQNLDVRVGINMDKEFEPEIFDAVTMFHVLEHVPSPTETLTQVNRILKNDGLLVFAVPNIASLPARWFGKCWFPLDLPRHVTHFSKETAEKILAKTGFKLEKTLAQQHGQTISSSLNYLARVTGKQKFKCFSRFKRICYLVELLSILRGQPARIVVQARKVRKINLNTEPPK